MVDSQELDNVGMPESTQYRAFFLEATSGVSYSLLVERLVELLGCALEPCIGRCIRQRRSLVPVHLQSLALLGVCTAAELLPDSLLFLATCFQTVSDQIYALCLGVADK